MDVKEIVAITLFRHEYDGLYNPDGECACLKDDLSPGNCLSELCKAGYKTKCKPETCNIGGCNSFHISKEKGD